MIIAKQELSNQYIYVEMKESYEKKFISQGSLE